MSRTFLFDSISAHLKARGHTYRQLDEAIGVSEPTVKRIFATNDCTIERREEICQFLNIELAQLLNSTPKKRKLVEQLTRKQEDEFAKNKKLLMVAICVMGLWSFEDMLSHLGSRYTVRRYVGESVLSAGRGWFWRNDFSFALCDSGQEFYAGFSPSANC